MFTVMDVQISLSPLSQSSNFLLKQKQVADLPSATRSDAAHLAVPGSGFWCIRPGVLPTKQKHVILKRA